MVCPWSALRSTGLSSGFVKAVQGLLLVVRQETGMLVQAAFPAWERAHSELTSAKLAPSLLLSLLISAWL